MNTNVKTKSSGLNPKMVFLILCMFACAFPALSQRHNEDKVVVLLQENENENEKVFAPDGVELPGWFDDWEIKYNVHYIPTGDLIIYEKPYFRDRNPYENIVRHKSHAVCSIENIERNKNETLVTLKTNIYWNWNWLFVDKKTCLIDTVTGDKYMLRDIQGAHEPGRLSAVHGLQGQQILQILVFPPLKKNVEVIDFYEPDNFKDTPSDLNEGGYREYGIVLSDYAKQHKKYPNAEIIY
jgi:hypothetical protein